MEFNESQSKLDWIHTSSKFIKERVKNELRSPNHDQNPFMTHSFLKISSCHKHNAHVTKTINLMPYLRQVVS